MKNEERWKKMAGYELRFRTAFEKSGLSQSAFAPIVGATQPLISNYLSGDAKPRPILSQKLAYSLKVSYPWLTWNMGEETYYPNTYPMELFHSTFEDRLIYLCWTNHHDTQSLSHALNKSGSAIQYWFEGQRRPSKKSLDDLCEILDADPTWLLYGSEDLICEPGSK